jgi:uncharacterized protein
VSSRNPEDLRRRLKRLGKHQSTRQETKKVKENAGAKIALDWGKEVQTSRGAAYRISQQYPHDYQHGSRRLSDIFAYQGNHTAAVARRPLLEDVELGRLAFVDTETTGLAGGAGTLAFLVGVGYFQDNNFILQQYFLREPGEEPGMLEAIREDFSNLQGYVTFNGQSFDLPLLESRFTISLRQRIALTSAPHFDLLPASRRLWRNELPNCRLGTLEQSILGVERTDEDVSGAQIPGMYVDYLRSGNASEMARVIYHNAIDILSLVTLTSQILDRHTDQPQSSLTASEALGVARWNLDQGRKSEAEAALREVASLSHSNLRLDALRRLSAYQKSEGRRREAIKSWELLHDLDPIDPNPCIEIAKYFEWDTRDLLQAQYWSQQALLSLSHWKAGWRRDQIWGEVEHRLKRLAHKLTKTNTES